ncbi:MFS transporter [Actinocrispum sp. NPDC049592]|uniref:MFS transporter n=1 Tax=Actinocrispum sp. NPDC049592 TaxID=3154835 RepID=UPI00343D7D67
MTKASGRATFRDVFAVGEFRALWFAELLSMFGDQLARVALSILVYQKTNSAALTGLTYALTYAPSLLGGIFLSPIADRFPRREVMVAVDVIRAVVIGVAAIPGVPYQALWGLVAIVSLANPPFKASQLALMPDVLAGDRYVVGMAIRSMTIQTAQMLGFVGGGVLILSVDPHVGLLIDALTFVVSAAFVRFGLRYRPAAARPTQRVPFLASVSAGGRLLFADHGLRTLLLYTWFLSLLTVYEGLAVPYAAEFHGSSAAVGLLLAADPLGSVIGTFAFTRWVSPDVRPRLVGILAILASVVLLVCFLHPGLIVSILVFMAGGVLGATALMQATASLSLAVPDSARAQAMGLSNSGLSTITGISPAIGGVIADQLGSTATTVGVFGIVGLALAVPLGLAWQKELRTQPQRWIPGDSTPTGQS